jgi:hypothetical protein
MIEQNPLAVPESPAPANVPTPPRKTYGIPSAAHTPKQYWLAVSLITLLLFTYLPFSLHADSDKAKGLGWGVSYAISAAVWVGVILLLNVFYRRSRGVNAAATRLGWEHVDNGLWQDVAAMPINAVGKMMGSSVISGTWRGRNAQSLTVSPARRGSLMLVIASVDVMELPGPLPRMEIARHGKNKLGGPGSGDDLDMESIEFNENFSVATLDREFAHAILNPRMIERLLQPDARDLSLTICGDRILVWATPPADANSVESRLNVLADVVDLIPEFIYEKWSTGGDRRVAADGTAQPVVATVSKKNWLGWCSLLFAMTIVLAPIGLIFGHRGLRAVKRGEASNATLTMVALFFCYIYSSLYVIGLAILLFTWGS